VASVITSKAANGIGRPGLRLFYPAASCGGKSVLVRQLRGVSMSQTPLSLAGFQVILIGRFWVIAEGGANPCVLPVMLTCVGGTKTQKDGPLGCCKLFVTSIQGRLTR